MANSTDHSSFTAAANVTPELRISVNGRQLFPAVELVTTKENGARNYGERDFTELENPRRVLLHSFFVL